MNDREQQHKNMGEEKKMKKQTEPTKTNACDMNN